MTDGQNCDSEAADEGAIRRDAYFTTFTRSNFTASSCTAQHSIRWPTPAYARMQCGLVTNRSVESPRLATPRHPANRKPGEPALTSSHHNCNHGLLTHPASLLSRGAIRLPTAIELGDELGAPRPCGPFVGGKNVRGRNGRIAGCALRSLVSATDVLMSKDRPFDSQRRDTSIGFS